MRNGRSTVQSSSEPLHILYRPKHLNEVVGQDEICQSLGNVLRRNTARTFLFCGPSGCGKTTLARIASNMLHVERQGILEIDGATYTGIDDMRRVQDVLLFRAFGKQGNRAIIIDESQGLSKQAWSSILKATEEPPEHVTWFFCTTEPTKVPDAIKTRSVSYTLNLVQEHSLRKLCASVCKSESIKAPTDVLDLVVREANGSPRQMLVNLEKCRDAVDKSEAAKLLRTLLDNDATLELCRFLLKKGSWQRAIVILKKLADASPEGIRISVCNYMGSVARDARTDGDAMHALSIINIFSTPFNPSERDAPLMLAIGRVLFEE